MLQISAIQLAELLAGIGRAQAAIVQGLENELAGVRSGRIVPALQNAAHLRDPDAGRDEPSAGQADGHLGGGTVRLAEQRHGAAVRIGHGVALLLPAVARERLLEVARAVEQADGDDRHAQIACRLQVIAREDAETARVLGQRGGDAVLG